MQFAADGMAEANQQAFERLTKSEPVLVDVRPAGEFIEGFTPQTILTSGPPMAWSELHRWAAGGHYRRSLVRESRQGQN